VIDLSTRGRSADRRPKDAHDRSKNVTDHEVRLARHSDLPAIQAAVADSWRVGYDGVIYADRLAEATSDPAEFYPGDRFESKLADDELAFLVAIPEGEAEPRGIANVNWESENTHEFVPEGESQFRAVYVHPEHWGEGVGTALFEAGLEHLSPGLDRIWVECLDENDRGKRFYRSLGFSAVDGREIDLYGEPHETRILRREL
jgi:ribosomal protein S18 acetylase RimI-like enzyme